MYFYVHFLSRRFQSLSGAASEWRKLRVASKAWPARKPPEVRIPKNECLISAVQECARYRPVYRSWYGYRYIMIHIYIMHVIYCYITTSSGQQSQLLIHWSTHLHRRPGKEILMMCQGLGQVSVNGRTKQNRHVACIKTKSSKEWSMGVALS